jgi:hypothetical protein
MPQTRQLLVLLDDYVGQRCQQEDKSRLICSSSIGSCVKRLAGAASSCVVICRVWTNQRGGSSCVLFRGTEFELPYWLGVVYNRGSYGGRKAL